MALESFSTDLHAVNINGRLINDWGDSDPPYTESPIDQKTTLKRGFGGRAVRFDRINPGQEVVLNLMPGSPDSAFMQALMNSNADISLGRYQVGTLESAVGAEGAIINRGQKGRGGASLSDDQYIIQFNVWTETAGGE